MPGCNTDFCASCARRKSKEQRKAAETYQTTLTFRAVCHLPVANTIVPKIRVPEAPLAWAEPAVLKVVLPLLLDSKVDTLPAAMSYVRLCQAVAHWPAGAAAMAHSHAQQLFQRLQDLLGWLLNQRVPQDADAAKPSTAINAAGHVATLAKGVARSGQCVQRAEQYYCGRLVSTGCRSVCGPSDQCPCADCRELTDVNGHTVDTVLARYLELLVALGPGSANMLVQHTSLDQWAGLLLDALRGCAGDVFLTRRIVQVIIIIK